MDDDEKPQRKRSASSGALVGNNDTVSDPGFFERVF